MKYISQVVLSLVLSGFLFTGCGSAAKQTGFSGTSEALQHDLDLVRLQDLKTLSGYIEKYREEEGRYPFQGETGLPHYVRIATREQQKYLGQGPPYEHKTSPSKRFVLELQKVLGNIEVPFDLQRVPVNKPNFYIYLITDDAYFLAVHLHNDYSFGTTVSRNYNKVEVTNNEQAVRPGVWLRSELLSHPEYNAALQAQAYKPGYTAQLREKLGGNSAF